MDLNKGTRTEEKEPLPAIKVPMIKIEYKGQHVINVPANGTAKMTTSGSRA